METGYATGLFREHTPSKGSFFTRGTSKDEYARYTESGEAYVRGVNRLTLRVGYQQKLVPSSEPLQEANQSSIGILFFGTSNYAAREALDRLQKQGVMVDAMRIRAFPFDEALENFVATHDQIFVVEQNRDAQMRSLLINELDASPQKLIPLLNYDGMPITAGRIIAGMEGKTAAVPV